MLIYAPLFSVLSQYFGAEKTIEVNQMLADVVLEKN